MTLYTEAIYDEGVLRLTEPMPIAPRQRVRVAIDVPANDADAGSIAARVAALRATSGFRMGPKPTREEMNGR